MVDVHKPATLQGFPVSVADIGDQVHFFLPLLSFEGDSALYLVHRLNWQNDPEALVIADPNEASTLGTLLPPTYRWPIASGKGLVAVGASFVQAAATAGVELLDSEISFARVDGFECWIGMASPAVYADLRTRLLKEARSAFDEALGDAVFHKSRLSERGDAALLLMRKCGLGRRDDLAIRQLSGAQQNGEFDLYRRLLIRFAFELDTQEGILDKRVKRHIAHVADWKEADLSGWLLRQAIPELDTRGIADVADWKDRSLHNLAQSGAFSLASAQSGIVSNSQNFPHWTTIVTSPGRELERLSVQLSLGEINICLDKMHGSARARTGGQ